MTTTELWTQLSDAGLVSGDRPAATPPQAPWPVRAMLGIAGWIGALFFLGFAGAAFHNIFNNAAAALPAGALCCAAAYAIFRALPHNGFLSQFGFALSLAGQALLLAGLIDLNGDRPSIPVFLSMAAILTALAIAVPNYIHRVFTTVAANFCLFLAAGMAGAPALATIVAAIGAVLIWLHPVRIAARPAFWQALGYGFAIALLHLDGALLIGPEFWRMLLPKGAPAPHFLLWAGPAIAGLVLVYAAWQLREGAGIFTVATAIVAALCGLAAPGIGAALLILILGFANSNRVLIGLGLLAFGGYLSHFYYQLTYTLLAKSAVLAATGAALLALRWAAGRFLPTEKITNA